MCVNIFVQCVGVLYHVVAVYRYLAFLSCSFVLFLFFVIFSHFLLSYSDLPQETKTFIAKSPPRGILHKKICCLNLIFWIVIGYGIARFGPQNYINPNILVSQVCRASKLLGTIFETKIFKFSWFLAYATPHYYPKYVIKAIEICFVGIPLIGIDIVHGTLYMLCI